MTPMPFHIPEFLAGVHYARRTPWWKFWERKWKWVLLRDLTLEWPEGANLPGCGVSCLVFRDASMKVWMEMGRRRMVIRAGYAWNGSSFSPDLPGVMLSSCVHDAIYQWCGCKGWPQHLTRDWADDLFCALSSSGLRELYHAGLRQFSAMCWAKRSGGGEFIEIHHI